MTKGFKYDKGKNQVDLVDPLFILDVGNVLTYGANKYGPNNWQKVDNPINRYYAAVMRHLLAWRSGEIYDKESGFHHLKCVAANIMFLLFLEREKK